MNDRNSPSPSFNTVKRSNRKRRQERIRRERLTVLSICAVVILLLLTLAVFLFCLMADPPSHGENPDGGDTPDTGNPPTSVIYTTVSKLRQDLHVGELILVSEELNLAYQYPQISMKSFLDADMNVQQNGVEPYNSVFLKSNEQMYTPAAYAVDAMLTDFYNKFQDSSLIMMDAYRTKEEQDTKQTKVGYSEHETGLVFTLRTYDPLSYPKNQPLSKNLNYNWIYANCSKYGIICRYPENKASITGINGYDYCFRYVGIPHATYITQNGLCLEEYVELLKTNYASGAHLSIKGADGNDYEVYYVAASSSELTSIKIPQNYQYTISGDNVGGFIVTIHLDEPAA